MGKILPLSVVASLSAVQISDCWPWVAKALTYQCDCSIYISFQFYPVSSGAFMGLEAVQMPGILTHWMGCTLRVCHLF